MPFDPTKFDLQLNGVDYRIRGYQKSEFSSFIPRLSSGDQEESDFDLLRSETIDLFTGGALQKHLDDTSSVYAIEGMTNKNEDGVLYATDGIETLNQYFAQSASSYSEVTAYAQGVLGTVVVTYETTNYSTYQARVYWISALTGVKSYIASSTAITSNTRVTDVVCHNGSYWLATNENNTFYYVNALGTSVIKITGTFVGAAKMVSFREELYFTTSDLQVLYRYTGNASTPSQETVGTIQLKGSISNDGEMLVYNNRVIIMTKVGMYGYDGVQINSIEESRYLNISNRDYRFPCVLRGYLYYFMEDGLYRFNGSLIEKLYTTKEVGYPADMIAENNHLWIIYPNSDYNGSSLYDKNMGRNYESTTSKGGSLWQFDGTGMFLFSLLPTWTFSSGSAHTDRDGDPHMLVAHKGIIHIATFNDYNQNTYRIDQTPTTSREVSIVLSITDNGFSQILKALENLEMQFFGNISEQTVQVQYKITEFDHNTNWTTLGNMNTVALAKYDVWRDLQNSLNYQRILLRFNMTINLDYGIEKIISRYLLMPDYKNQWQFTALCYDEKVLTKLAAQDTTETAQGAELLRGNIYRARNSKQAVGFVDIDRFFLDGSITAGSLTITLTNAELFMNSSGFVLIDNEIIYYAGVSGNQLTGCIRGRLGTSAASHADGALVLPYYRVIVRQIQNERVELTEELQPVDQQIRESEITLVLQEV